MMWKNDCHFFHSFSDLNHFLIPRLGLNVGFNGCRDQSLNSNAWFRHHQTDLEAELLNYSSCQSSVILSNSRNNIRAQCDDCFLVTTLGQFQHLTPASHHSEFKKELMSEEE